MLGETKLRGLLVPGDSEVKEYKRRAAQMGNFGGKVVTISYKDLDLHESFSSLGPQQRACFSELTNRRKGSRMYTLGTSARAPPRGGAASSSSARGGSLSSGVGSPLPERCEAFGASFLVNSVLYADTLSERKRRIVAAV